MWKVFLSRPFFLASPFLFIFLLLLLPVRIRIAIDNIRKDKGISAQLTVIWGGKIELWRTIKVFPATFDLDSFLKQCLIFFKEKDGWYKKGKIQLQKTAGTVYRLMRVCTWEKLDIWLNMGLGDPARTAYSIGFLRHLSGWGLPQMMRLLSFKKGSRPYFLFYPSFLKYEFVFLLSLEFTVNGLKFIFYGVKIFHGIFFESRRIYLWRQSKKWQSIRSKV